MNFINITISIKAILPYIYIILFIRILFILAIYIIYNWEKIREKIFNLKFIITILTVIFLSISSRVLYNNISGIDVLNDPLSINSVLYFIVFGFFIRIIKLCIDEFDTSKIEIKLIKFNRMYSIRIYIILYIVCLYLLHAIIMIVIIWLY